MQIKLQVDLSRIVITVVLLILVGALSACAILGSGRSTLVLADPLPSSDNDTPKYSGSEFKYLIAASNEKRLIGPHTIEQWEAFKNDRLGGTDANVASIDINVRDQSNTPPLELFNYETANASDIFKILTNPSSNDGQKRSQLLQLRNNYRSMPETDLSYVRHSFISGKELYYYYPRITIDLTSTLNTAETLDRFDYIAAAIRIPDCTDAKFINFSPKAADLFEFTLGQFKQTAAAKASASTNNKVTANATTGNNSTGAAGTGTSVGGELGYGGSVDFTLTDELTRDLKSSLEARSTGIMKKGKLFLIELRSNEQKRISGTYSFNVMLEVPSTPAPGQLENKHTTFLSSEPNTKYIKAEVRVVGIVRHVVKPGKIGIFEQVPEPLNDVTFRQVVLHDQNVTLWEFTDIPISYFPRNLAVYSNIDGASFSIVDEISGEILDQGSGREAHFVVDVKKTVKVIFMPAIIGGDKPVVLKALDATGIKPGMNGVAIGNYLPTLTSTSNPTTTSTSKPTPTLLKGD
jgi:hypothetical protein